MTIVLEVSGFMNRRRISNVRSLSIIFKAPSPNVPETQSYLRVSHEDDRDDDILTDTIINIQVIP